VRPLRLLLALVGYRLWIHYRSDRRPAERSEPDDGSELALAKTLLSHVAGLLHGQLRDSDQLDLKALGLAAADAAVLALFVTERESLTYWWIPAIPLVTGIVYLIGAVQPRQFDTGPDTAEFRRINTGLSPAEIADQMLADLLEGISRNEPILEQKLRRFQRGYLLLLTGLCLCVVFAFVGHHRDGTIRGDGRPTTAPAQAASKTYGDPYDRGEGLDRRAHQHHQEVTIFNSARCGSRKHRS
jgi:hypothetical protein